MKRTIFIGDVHGCVDELTMLISKLNLDLDDRLIFVGDLVDKGPDSLDTLRFVNVLVQTHDGSVVVCGNHEEKALRDVVRSGSKAEPWVAMMTDEDLDFLESMPLTWYDAELNIRVVHGGIFPSLLNNHPDVFEKIKARGGKWRKGGGKVMNRARRMLRIRYVGGAVRMETGEKPGPGDMLELGANREGDPFWADVYDGSQGFVIYGHSPWLDGKIRHRDAFSFGIDTACVFGGKLTALVLDPDATVCVRPGPAPTIGGVSYSLVTVNALKRYAEPLKED